MSHGRWALPTRAAHVSKKTRQSVFPDGGVQGAKKEPGMFLFPFPGCGLGMGGL